MSPNPTHPVVVIGSGFGGLAAAVRLRAQGHRVLVLEANEQPGGRASVFVREGYSFDAGPTVITAPHLIAELFTLLGRDPDDYFELMPVDPFYRVEFPDGSRFDYVGEEERIIEQIRAMSPQDVDGYRRLAKQAEAIFAVGYDQLVDAPFDSVWDMMKVVPDMVRLGSYRTVYGMVATFLKDERLRQVFTFQPLLVGGNPFNTTSIYLLIHWLERKWGVWFPRGGTTAVVKALVKLLEEVDVEVRCNAPVGQIEVEGGRAVAVRLEDGTRIPCSAVVSNADPSTVYTKLIDPRHRSTHTDRSVARKEQSMSLVVGYFGTKSKYPDIAHHTILLGPRYKGLLDDIFGNKVLAEDFSLYLHRPTASDPSLAPEGGDAFYVLSPVPNDRSGIDWEKVGPAYYDRILDFLDAKVMPGVRSDLAVNFHVDPRYFAGRLRSTDGAAFGLEPRLTQSAWFRYHNRSEDVEGLYFVGASTHPGAGVPGVLNTAKVLMKVMPAPAHPLPVPGPAPRRVAS
jgi:phytoene desaturase